MKRLLRKIIRAMGLRGHVYKLRAVLMRNPAKLVAGSPADRLQGLETLLQRVNGGTVLDIGCHDGTVAEAFAKAGASRIDGCDIFARGIEIARDRVSPIQKNSAFYVTDFSRGASVLEPLPLLERYDIVCYLGVHHHLFDQMTEQRLEQFAAAVISRCERFMAIRSPRHHLDRLHQTMIAAGMVPIGPAIRGRVGASRIYERQA